jgi:polyhydroxyalkanoate synthesis regulator phasin
MANKSLRELLETGMYFTEENRAKAEKLVRDLVKQGELRRKDAEETLQALMARGKEATEQILGLVQAEVAKQMSRFTEQFDEVEERLEDYAKRLGIPWTPIANVTGMAKRATTAASPSAATKAPAKKATAKKTAKRAPAKKSAAKKSATKKSAAKKTAAKKSAAKKTAAKKTASS